MSAEPLTRAELDRPGAAYVIGSPCKHKRGALVVKYWGDGVLELRCRVCNTFVLSAKVSEKKRADFVVIALRDCPSKDCPDPIENHYTIVKPTCHPTAGHSAIYDGGAIVVSCGTCHHTTAKIAIQ